MGRTTITPARLAVMTLFVVSCFGLLLFLWKSFGGPVPLQPQGYRVAIDFPDAGRLAVQADVRISGVSVGKVVMLDQAGERTHAVLELQPRYAPLPSDARALLRQKSALGETYVELTPGTTAAAPVREGGALAGGQVADAVLLDEALQAFDPRTRKAFRQYLDGWSTALDGRGEDLSAVLGRLAPTEVQATRALQALDSQRRAVGGLLRDGGRVLQAVGDREAAVRSVIRDGDRVLAVTASRQRALRDSVRALPALVRAARRATHEVAVTSTALTPALTALRPAARDLAPTLRALDRATPQFRALSRLLGRDLDASVAGLPAAARLVRAVPALSAALDPVARDLDPVLEYLARYKAEIASPFAIVSAVSQAVMPGVGGKLHHYVRLVPNLTSETITLNPRRPAADRFNPYPAPRWLDKLATGLESYSCDHLANVTQAPAIGTGSPPCVVQAPVTFRGATSQFPHLTRSPRRTTP